MRTLSYTNNYRQPGNVESEKISIPQGRVHQLFNLILNVSLENIQIQTEQVLFKNTQVCIDTYINIATVDVKRDNVFL